MTLIFEVDLVRRSFDNITRSPIVGVEPFKHKIMTESHISEKSTGFTIEHPDYNPYPGYYLNVTQTSKFLDIMTFERGNTVFWDDEWETISVFSCSIQHNDLFIYLNDKEEYKNIIDYMNGGFRKIRIRWQPDANPTKSQISSEERQGFSRNSLVNGVHNWKPTNQETDGLQLLYITSRTFSIEYLYES